MCFVKNFQLISSCKIASFLELYYRYTVLPTPCILTIAAVPLIATQSREKLITRGIVTVRRPNRAFRSTTLVPPTGELLFERRRRQRLANPRDICRVSRTIFGPRHIMQHRQRRVFAEAVWGKDRTVVRRGVERKRGKGRNRKPSTPPSPPLGGSLVPLRAVQYRGNITLLPSFILRSPAETSTLILRRQPSMPPLQPLRASKLASFGYTSRPLCFNNTVYIGTRSIDLFARASTARVHVALKDGHIGWRF